MGYAGESSSAADILRGKLQESLLHYSKTITALDTGRIAATLEWRGQR
jgi:hypothetical protein